MREWIAASALALMVAGCGNNGQGQQSQANTSIETRSEAQDALFKLNDLNRAIALKRAIYDSGYRCGRITRSGFVDQYKNLDMWMASCADGRDWAIFTGPDGSAQVRDCKDLAGLGLPQCVIEDQSGEAGAAANEVETSG
jgi:hypothetical protein